MKSIKFNNVEWFYNEEKDLNLLSLLKILDEININLKKLKFNELIKESTLFNSTYISTKFKAESLLLEKVNEFNTFSRRVFNKTSYPPIISYEHTIKIMEITFTK